MNASDLKRVKVLKAENARLKRMYAELALDNAAMKELIAKNCRPTSKREAVQYPVEVHVPSLRWCFACVGFSRAAYYRPSLDWTVRDA